MDGTMLTFVIPNVKSTLVTILSAGQCGQYAVFDGINLFYGYSP